MTSDTPRHDRRWGRFLAWSAGLTLLAEAITLGGRWITGLSAAEINPRLPLVLQVHHMFWSIPFLVAACVWRRKRKASDLLCSVGIALVASDLIHHFVVLPLLVGNTGWHWP